MHATSRMGRRARVAVLVAGTVLVGSLVAVAPGAAADPVINSLGVQLPDDAAPLDQQVYRFAAIEGKHFDIARNEYEGFAYEFAAEYLARRDGNNVYHPAAADSWEVSADGLTWTFHLRQNAMWSDGVPVTADDWVFSLQRYEDPTMANPLASFFYGIQNAEEYNTGSVGVEEFGVKKVDDYTFTITTKEPIPYFMDIANWHYLVPKHQVEALGDAWADSPETAVSNGPWVIQSWEKGSKVMYGLNPEYTGPFKPKLEHMELVVVPESDAPLLQMFQAGELDYVQQGGDALAQAINDPAMKDSVYPQSVFTTAYLFFNDTKPPFNDLRVRQAISHAIDRDALGTVMQGLIEPAYGMLPKGFPCTQNDNPDLRAVQAFDPALAKQLLAEAGFPDGAGFPTFELWTRSGQYTREAEAIQNMLTTNLGITVTVKDQERSFFMDQLGAHAIDFGLLQWGADYPDPSNFMDWWATQSRHTWTNPDFNTLVDQARGEIDPTKRCDLYHQAEMILTTDVGGVFVEFPVLGEFYQPWVGDIPLNDQGLPGVLTQVVMPSVYIKQH